MVVWPITILFGSTVKEEWSMTIVSTGDGGCSTLPCVILLLNSFLAQMLLAWSSRRSERMEDESGIERCFCIMESESSNSIYSQRIAIQNKCARQLASE